MAEGVSGSSGIGTWFESVVSKLSGAFKKVKGFQHLKEVKSVAPEINVRLESSSFVNPVPGTKIQFRTTCHASQDQVVSIQAAKPSARTTGSQTLKVSLLTLNVQRDKQEVDLARATTIKETVKDEIRVAAKKASLSVVKFIKQPEGAALKGKLAKAMVHERNVKGALAKTEQVIEKTKSAIRAQESGENRELEGELQRLLRNP